jgi:3-phytase
MRTGFICSIAIVIAGQVFAAEPLFDEKLGILNLPEVVVVPEENSTYSATLRQIDDSDFIVEVETLTPSNRSFISYDPSQGMLYIPSLTIGDETYKNVQFELIRSRTENDSMRFRMVAKEIDRNVLHKVLATVETLPVPATGDAADDAAIWIHPSVPARSTIIGTQKQGGLGVYDLAGQEIQYLSDGNMNNVDLRYEFPINGDKVAIVAASNRSDNSIALYQVNPNSRKLENIAARTIFVGLKKTAYGLCMYRSPSSGKYYVFINDKSGAVEQWELFENGQKLVDATLVRSFGVDSQVEGCVADDVLGHFYLGEERVGIWKFGAEPDSGDSGYLIDQTTVKGGHLTPEVEGLAIYYSSETDGYLIASNQGNDSYTVYHRAGNNDYLGRFQIVANEELKIDDVNDTDGIDVVNVPLGKNFRYGVFVAQDGENIDPDENQNFKLVPWEHIADVLGLQKESSYRPR